MHHAARILDGNDLHQLYKILKKRPRTTWEIVTITGLPNPSSRISELRLRLWEQLQEIAVLDERFYAGDFDPVPCERLPDNKNGRHIHRWSLDLPDGFRVEIKEGA